MTVSTLYILARAFLSSLATLAGMVRFLMPDPWNASSLMTVTVSGMSMDVSDSQPWNIHGPIWVTPEANWTFFSLVHHPKMAWPKVVTV